MAEQQMVHQDTDGCAITEGLGRFRSPFARSTSQPATSLEHHDMQRNNKITIDFILTTNFTIDLLNNHIVYKTDSMQLGMYLSAHS